MRLPEDCIFPLHNRREAFPLIDMPARARAHQPFFSCSVFITVRQNACEPWRIRRPLLVHTQAGRRRPPARSQCKTILFVVSAMGNILGYLLETIFSVFLSNRTYENKFDNLQNIT